MTALVRRGIADRRLGLLAWSLSVGLTGAFFMFVWPSVEGAVSEVIDKYPPALKEAFGITSLSTAEEYLNAELFSLILPLAIGIFALRGVAAAIDGAEERGYLDVLLSAPISRRRVAAATFGAVALELAAILLAGWALTWLGSLVVGADLSAARSLAGYAEIWPLALFVAGVAMLVTGVSRHSGAVSGIAASVLVAMYIADLLGRLTDSLDWLRYLSVFRYCSGAVVDGIDPLAFAGTAAAAILLAAAGAVLLERRDLAA